MSSNVSEYERELYLTEIRRLTDELVKYRRQVQDLTFELKEAGKEIQGLLQDLAGEDL